MLQFKFFLFIKSLYKRELKFTAFSFLLSIMANCLTKSLQLDEDDVEDITMNCEPFIETMDLFKHQLYADEKYEAFQLPEYLKSMAHVYLFHEKTKTVLFKNIPKDIVLVDMLRNPDEGIKFINQLVCEKTNGMFKELDETTQCNLHSSAFRYLLLGIFYLKAKWDGVDVGSFPFHNKNGTFKNVPYFSLESENVSYVNGSVQVIVPYQHSKNDDDSFVVFSKPVFNWSKDCKSIIAYLPKLDLETRLERNENLDTTVIIFKYKQDEKGFEAACLFGADSVDSASCVQEIYFNEPFKIDIYFQHVKIFEVDIKNL